MSYTSRINSGRINSSKGFRYLFNKRARSSESNTFRHRSSIYQQVNQKPNEKKNALERFQELRRKMAISKNNRHKKITMQSVTLDLFQDKDKQCNFQSEISCTKIMYHIKQQSEELKKTHDFKAQTTRSKFRNKQFKPFEQNKNVRIIYNTGGRLIQYTPETRKQICARQLYKLPKQQPAPSLSKTHQMFYPKKQTCTSQRHSKFFSRPITVTPNRKKPSQTKQTFMQNVLPWQSQQYQYD